MIREVGEGQGSWLPKSHDSRTLVTCRPEGVVLTGPRKMKTDIRPGVAPDCKTLGRK